MPANLTPEFLAAEEQYRQAQTREERIAALERMLATVPKHKGTEKLQADIKRKLAQVRKESPKRGAAHATPFYVIKKEGAGQVALLGPPNSGKSQLVCALTHARPQVAPYPFTTRLPTPGMMYFEDVPIQLVDLPPLCAEYAEPWLPQVIRYASLSVLVVDPTDPAVLEQTEFVFEWLEQRRLPGPRLLVGNKADLAEAEQSFAALAELYGTRCRTVCLSALTGRNLDRFARALFEALEVVRVYTKVPGKKPDLTAPYLLRRGQTVEDAARLVHQDFAERLKFARLYRLDAGRDGLMVERHHPVEDKDILEFHI
ncbi:MAG: GTPase [Bryobacterales bacterium]|nr:50S ribosome-binding GTPase [Bryobacteraceae bacterium]MDW8356002.1 GTPase [Bryobacterales bacterium]